MRKIVLCSYHREHTVMQVADPHRGASAYRMAQPLFSWNGFSFLVLKPTSRWSLGLFSSMKAMISFTHSDTGLRCMLHSMRSCSTSFFCWAMVDMAAGWSAGHLKTPEACRWHLRLHDALQITRLCQEKYKSVKA